MDAQDDKEIVSLTKPPCFPTRLERVVCAFKASLAREDGNVRVVLLAVLAGLLSSGLLLAITMA